MTSKRIINSLKEAMFHPECVCIVILFAYYRSPEEIPPSQGVFGSQTPRMIPSSPTALVSNMPTASQVVLIMMYLK